MPTGCASCHGGVAHNRIGLQAPGPEPLEKRRGPCPAPAPAASRGCGGERDHVHGHFGEGPFASSATAPQQQERHAPAAGHLARRHQRVARGRRGLQPLPAKLLRKRQPQSPTMAGGAHAYCRSNSHAIRAQRGPPQLPEQHEGPAPVRAVGGRGAHGSAARREGGIEDHNIVLDSKLGHRRQQRQCCTPCCGQAAAADRRHDRRRGWRQPPRWRLGQQRECSGPLG
mmetsp:Transcript_99732/g.253568  ORF Transcript_99732/g.253568 Transcript_99732/m.253568 type:complete len:227 (+) Transcript_99732:434-1114(+)